MYLLVNISLKGLKTGLLVNMRLIRQVKGRLENVHTYHDR